jgi:hypothetical protein
MSVRTSPRSRNKIGKYTDAVAASDCDAVRRHRLGSFSPAMFQVLAVADEHVGEHAAAVAGARRALELDRFDPASEKVVASLTGGYP